MPNMFGGDQFHPDYHPGEAERVQKSDREFLLFGLWYRIIGEADTVRVTTEALDGTGGVAWCWGQPLDQLPFPVRERLIQLFPALA